VQFFSEAEKDGYAKAHAAVPQGREDYVGSRETKGKAQRLWYSQLVLDCIVNISTYITLL
jgi:hypothetical protein